MIHFISFFKYFKASAEHGSSRRFLGRSFLYDYFKNLYGRFKSYPFSAAEHDYEYKDKEYAANNESNLKNNSRKPLTGINWRRIGHAMDRQFGFLSVSIL